MVKFVISELLIVKNDIVDRSIDIPAYIKEVIIRRKGKSKSRGVNNSSLTIAIRLITIPKIS